MGSCTFCGESNVSGRENSNVGGHLFGMVMQADSLMKFLFIVGSCLGKVTG